MKIETDRLIIRSFEKSDLEDYAAIVSDPRVTRYLSSSDPHSFEEAADYITWVIEEEMRTGIVRYAVTLKESGELIGFCGFKQIGDSVDLGWRYGYAHWGNGYGSEAAKAVFDYGNKVLKLDSLFCVAMVENVASVKIIQKLGFKDHEYDEVRGKRTVKYFNLGEIAE